MHLDGLVPKWNRRETISGPRGGGGGTDFLNLGTDLETTVPLFGHGQPLVLPSPNLQPPLFVEAQGQPLQIVIFL